MLSISFSSISCCCCCCCSCWCCNWTPRDRFNRALWLPPSLPGPPTPPPTPVPLMGGGRKRDGSNRDCILLCFFTGVRLGDDLRLLLNDLSILVLKQGILPWMNIRLGHKAWLTHQLAFSAVFGMIGIPLHQIHWDRVVRVHTYNLNHLYYTSKHKT